MNMTPTPAGFSANWLGQRVVFADGALERLAAEADGLGGRRVLLIAGRSGAVSDRVYATARIFAPVTWVTDQPRVTSRRHPLGSGVFVCQPEAHH